MSDFGDGVALMSASHPPLAWWRRIFVRRGLRSQSSETLELDLPVYAHAGETVTCENDHPICDFVETVHAGQMQRLETQLGNWRQVKPTIGQIPIPGCAICGKPFTDGTIFHIGDAWRDPFHWRGSANAKMMTKIPQQGLDKV